jgi:capsular exopolysaccharide synthesis family protein
MHSGRPSPATTRTTTTEGEPPVTLLDYWHILRRSWLLILGTTVFGAAVATALSLAQTPVYQAQAQLFVSVQSGDEISGAYTGGLYVQQRIKSYVTVVDSPGVLEPVIEDLGLDTTPSRLAGDVTAVNPTNTVLLNVQASDTDPTRAAAIADAAARSLAAEIVRLETTESGARPVKAELIRPAEVPTTPVSPRVLLNVVLGALLGFMVGVGVAILRRVMDTSVTTTGELADAAQASTLGVVSFDPDAVGRPLVTLRGTPRAEAFRTIRTNLRYVDVDNPPRSVVITSSLPNEGKSTTACNLAIALAQAGSKVLLLEGDLRRPKVAEYLGVDGAIGLTDVLIGQVPLDAAIQPWEDGLLDFLASGAIPPNPSELLGSRQMAELLEQLAARYDVIIVDAPPLLPVSDAAILATVTDGAILVTRHGSTRQEQVEHAADALRQVGARVLGTILNFAPLRRRGSYGYGSDYGYSAGYPSAGDRRVLHADEMPAPDPRP